MRRVDQHTRTAGVMPMEADTIQIQVALCPKKKEDNASRESGSKLRAGRQNTRKRKTHRSWHKAEERMREEGVQVRKSQNNEGKWWVGKKSAVACVLLRCCC